MPEPRRYAHVYCPGCEHRLPGVDTFEGRVRAILDNARARRWTDEEWARVLATREFQLEAARDGNKEGGREDG